MNVIEVNGILCHISDEDTAALKELIRKRDSAEDVQLMYSLNQEIAEFTLSVRKAVVGCPIVTVYGRPGDGILTDIGMKSARP